MEIHPPEHRISTFKDFAVHIAIVTVGILIALGLEQATEAMHHRHIAHLARENFKTEIEQNRQKLQIVLQNNEKVHEFVVQMLNSKEQLRKGDASAMPKASVSPTFTTLRASSWDTAMATQSMLYLPYEEANRLADVYHTQRQFNELEAKDQELWFQIAGFRGDPAKLDAQEFASAERNMGTALAYSESVAALGEKLMQQYEQAESEK